MGNFSTTCMISGLPIGHGEPVRFISMMESPFAASEHIACYINSRHVPIHVPIKAEYNDYGSIENLEDSDNTRSFFEVLSELAIEREAENMFDAPVKKGMSNEEWLRALWEHQVQILRPTYLFSRRLDKQLEVLDEHLKDLIGCHYALFKPSSPEARRGSDPKPYQLWWAMIREDVWQAMLAVSPETSNQREMGLATYSLHPTDGYTADSEIELAIEYRRIQHAMHLLGRIWTPGHTSCPQCPEYRAQAPFTAAIAAIAQAERQREIDEDDDDY